MGSLQWSPTPSSFVPRGSAALRLSANCLNVDGIGATDKLRGRTFAKMCCLTSFFFFLERDSHSLLLFLTMLSSRKLTFCCRREIFLFPLK